MRLSLFADREPYTSYAQLPGEKGDYHLDVRAPEELGHAVTVDLAVIPADLYLNLAFDLRRAPSFAYGPTALMEASFAAGCLDYLREPWDLAELFARASRIRTLRARGGDFTVELRDCLLTISTPIEAEILLTEPERRLLRVLMLNAGLPVPRRSLSFALWGEERAWSRAADVHISSLRKRLEAVSPEMGMLIKASRRLGYRLLMEACA